MLISIAEGTPWTVGALFLKRGMLKQLCDRLHRHHLVCSSNWTSTSALNFFKLFVLLLAKRYPSESSSCRVSWIEYGGNSVLAHSVPNEFANLFYISCKYTICLLLYVAAQFLKHTHMGFGGTRVRVYLFNDMLMYCKIDQVTHTNCSLMQTNLKHRCLPDIYFRDNFLTH